MWAESSRLSWYLLLIALWLSPSVVWADPIQDASLGMSMTIPDGFAPDARVKATDPNFVFAFRRPGSEGILDTVIIVERMRALLPRTRLDPSQLPADFNGRLLTMQWKEFDVKAFEIRESVNGLETVTYNVQVPLKPNAIQLKIFGGNDQAAEHLELAKSLLASLEGQTNWISSIAAPSVSNSRAYGTVLLAVLGMFIICGLVGIFLIARRWTWKEAIGVAVVLIVIGFAISGGDSREVRGASGALRMTGFLGLLVAAASTLLPRRPTVGAVPPYVRH